MVRPGYIKRIASSIHSHVMCGWDGKGDYTRGHRSQVRTPVHTQLSRCIFSKGRHAVGTNGAFSCSAPTPTHPHTIFAMDALWGGLKLSTPDVEESSLLIIILDPPLSKWYVQCLPAILADAMRFSAVFHPKPPPQFLLIQVIWLSYICNMDIFYSQYIFHLLARQMTCLAKYIFCLLSFVFSTKNSLVARICRKLCSWIILQSRHIYSSSLTKNSRK